MKVDLWLFGAPWIGMAKRLGAYNYGDFKKKLKNLAFMGGSGERSLCRRPAGIFGLPEWESKEQSFPLGRLWVASLLFCFSQ